MRSKFVGIVAGLSLLATALPAQAAGLTPSQVSAVISLLQSFNVATDTITHVGMVLNGQASGGGPEFHMGMGSSTPGLTPPGQYAKMACIRLARNLNVGARGDDVKKLQELLMSDSTSGFTGTATGYFGPLTAKAMMQFQMMNGIASSTTGGVGPLTRGFFERRCGEGLSGERGPGMMGSTTNNH